MKPKNIRPALRDALSQQEIHQINTTTQSAMSFFLYCVFVTMSKMCFDPQLIKLTTGQNSKYVSSMYFLMQIWIQV